MFHLDLALYCLAGSAAAFARWDDSSLCLFFYFYSMVLLNSDASSGPQTNPRHPSTECPSCSCHPVYDCSLLYKCSTLHLSLLEKKKSCLDFWHFEFSSHPGVHTVPQAWASCILITLEAVSVIAQLGLWALLNKSGQREALTQWIGHWSDSLGSPVLFAVPLSQCSLRQAIRYS